MLPAAGSGTTADTIFAHTWLCLGRTSGVPEVLRETLAQSWPSVMPLGIAADMTQHLLWRLQRGELSASMRADAQLRMALLIGTNNLGKGHTVEQTVRGIVACATELLNSTRGSLLINALLPRGDRRKLSDLQLA